MKTLWLSLRSHFRYLWYITRHKWFVFIECCKLGIPWRGIVHDLSKLSPFEYNAYRLNFSFDWEAYGSPMPEELKDRFDEAWLHHIHKNPHHWQYWLLREDDGGTKLIPIPDVYRREMLADWRGAGKAITDG